MSVTAFNSSIFPRATPWECLTFDWFGELFRDERILNGIKNSFIIGAGTVILSVAMGLAGALMLDPGLAEAARHVLHHRHRADPDPRRGYRHLHAGLLGPDQPFPRPRPRQLPVERHLPDRDRPVPPSSPVIACWFWWPACSVTIPAQTEAALDLGATHAQAFRKVLLPFMRPGHSLGRGAGVFSQVSRTTIRRPSPSASIRL